MSETSRQWRAICDLPDCEWISPWGTSPGANEAGRAHYVQLGHGTHLNARPLREASEVDAEPETDAPSPDSARIGAALTQMAVPVVALVDELITERDQARKAAEELRAALVRLVDVWPTTSWGPSSEAHADAQELLNREGPTTTLW